jgi:hypothetical protein
MLALDTASAFEREANWKPRSCREQINARANDLLAEYSVFIRARTPSICRPTEAHRQSDSRAPSVLTVAAREDDRRRKSIDMSDSASVGSSNPTDEVTGEAGVVHLMTFSTMASFSRLGFVHSSYLFGLESHIVQTSINANIVPPGALLSLIQKGLYYTEAELSVGDVSHMKSRCCRKSKLVAADGKDSHRTSGFH